MRRRNLLATGVAAGLAAASHGTGLAETATGQHSIDDLLHRHRDQYGLPAVAAAVVKDGEIVAAGAVGTRRAGAEIPVTLNDRFHIGSDTKAMTALLAGMFVESGALQWSSRVSDIFPELAGAMNAELKLVSLSELLSHASGIPSDSDADEDLVFQSFRQKHKNLDELRYWIIERLVPRPLQSKPGERFAYANMGYVLAGGMIERVARRTWEELVVERIFDPLGLSTAGFGPQASLGRVDAPLGHWPEPDGSLKPMLAGPDGDSPVVLGPAGTVHLSVLDFAKWAGWNAGQGKRPPALVRPETLEKFHTKVIEMPATPDAKPGTPSMGGYGMGWAVVSLPYSPEPFIAHGGSNELNLASILVQPDRDFGMVLMTNVGGTKADTALNGLAEELYRRYAVKG